MMVQVPSPRYRSRVFLIGCAWFFAGSTLMTVLLSASDITDDGSTFYANNDVLHKRKPQSREYDYAGGSDDVSETVSASGDFSARLLQQEQHDNDVTVTSLNEKRSVDYQQPFRRSSNDVIENAIFWSQRSESFVPIGKCITITL